MYMHIYCLHTIKLYYYALRKHIVCAVCEHLHVPINVNTPGWEVWLPK